MDRSRKSIRYEAGAGGFTAEDLSQMEQRWAAQRSGEKSKKTTPIFAGLTGGSRFPEPVSIASFPPVEMDPKMAKHSKNGYSNTNTNSNTNSNTNTNTNTNTDSNTDSDSHTDHPGDGDPKGWPPATRPGGSVHEGRPKGEANVLCGVKKEKEIEFGARDGWNEKQKKKEPEIDDAFRVRKGWERMEQEKKAPMEEPDLPALLKRMEKDLGIVVDETLRRELFPFYVRLGGDLCLYAIEEGEKAEKHHWPYIRGILRNLLARGITRRSQIPVSGGGKGTAGNGQRKDPFARGGGNGSPFQTHGETTLTPLERLAVEFALREESED